MLVNIDVIILSYGKTTALQSITRNGIETLLASEEPEKIKLNVIVVESDQSLSPYQYPGAITIYPNTVFGYHKFMNIGLKACASTYVCLCNNDLVFHKHWATNILMEMDKDPALLSASPYDDRFHQDEGFSKFQPPLEGYMGVLSGWCIFTKRAIFDVIGPLDENLTFWYCDADYCRSLIKHGIKNCLVSSSFVTHLGSVSTKTLDKKESNKLTKLPEFYYRYKWQHQSYIKYKLQVIKYKLQIAFGLNGQSG
ncbi:glycosyltransferase family 2 protein [Mucilaginibacter xinganensis]|uniref:Glycosyltransferase 2-like domain-containing protein n=1 Tax=Mucilaginibacter xinganensis TaxID=1234841 RepID=A0A223NU26_9SPHI|nr:glycosyltransferase [Mucilaginibacter xinganensis]ASU33373.1 hypothetical protein MuYL_1475 [Mucilaginibacter xinganensis]